jgi:transcriptional regulator with XRE-family HTH domain
MLQLFNERLKEVREQLELTQDDMVSKTGIPKRSYCAYEAGEMAPNAKLLAGLASMGIDIGYLLTGRRIENTVSTPHLSSRQRALLDNYDHAPEAGKKIIEGTASMAAQQNAKYDVKAR